MGFQVIVYKKCGYLPAMDSITHPYLGSGFGYNASSISYTATYADGSSKTINAVYPLILLDSKDAVVTSSATRDSICAVPTVTPAPAPAHKPAPVVPKVENAPVASVTLPSEFKQEGSQTTDLSKLTTESAKSVSNFTLDNVGIGSIKYLEAVDLSSQDTANKFKNLSSYVQISYGKVKVDSEALGVLNKNEQINLNMNLVDGYEIVILKDGEVVDGAVSNIVYKDGVLSFEVGGFSEYVIKPILTLDDVESETNKKIISITGGVSDLSASVKMIVNGVEQAVEVDELGNFDVMIDLIDGNNDVKVVVTSLNGVVDEQELVINRKNNEESSMSDNGKDGNSERLFIWIIIGLGIIVFAIIIGVLVAIKIKASKKKIFKDN